MAETDFELEFEDMMIDTAARSKAMVQLRNEVSGSGLSEDERIKRLRSIATYFGLIHSGANDFAFEAVVSPNAIEEWPMWARIDI